MTETEPKLDLGKSAAWARLLSDIESAVLDVDSIDGTEVMGYAFVALLQDPKTGHTFGAATASLEVNPAALEDGRAEATKAFLNHHIEGMGRSVVNACRVAVEK